jgi:hypothetical protein
MEPTLIIIAVILALCIIVTPAIWSHDAVRRAAAQEVLRMILTAFGRRPV